MLEGSTEATVPRSSLLRPLLKALLRGVVGQDRKKKNCDVAESFQEEVGTGFKGFNYPRESHDRACGPWGGA